MIRRFLGMTGFAPSPMRTARNLLFGGALLAAALSGAEVRPIAPNLAFFRVRDLAADVPPRAPEALIIDLRYVQAPDTSAVSALRQSLTAPGPLRLVLLDAQPGEAIVNLLQERAPNVLTVGPHQASPPPDISVTVEPQADRAAYEAVEAGEALSAVIAATQAKRRFDEAALVQARANRQGRAGGGTPEGATQSEQAAAEVAAAPPADLLLQHAVRVARGLQALGRS